MGVLAVFVVPAARAADERVPGQVVVGFAGSASAQERGSVRRSLDARLVTTLGEPRQQLLKLRRGADVDAVVRRLERRRTVTYAEPNFVVRAATLPDDPHFAEQWALRNTGQAVGGVTGTVGEDVHAQAAWDLTQGSDDVLVAVVDSGINYGHPDLAPNVWRNAGESGGGHEHNGVDDDGNGVIDDVFPQDRVAGDHDPVDENGHGTRVAGVLAARGNDGFGTTGLAWRAKILPIRVLDGEGFGDTASVAAGFRDAAQRGASIVNASIEGARSEAVADAIGDAGDTLFVVASGNSGVDLDGGEPDWPCAYTFENMICVGAADADGRLAPFSNHGDVSVDLAAPGVFVLAPELDQQRRTVWTEDFETPLAGRWISGGTGDEWGRSTLWSASPTHSLADSPDGDHAASVDSWVETVPPLDLSGLADCRLDYTIEKQRAEESYFGLWAVSGDGSTDYLADLYLQSGRQSVPFGLSGGLTDLHLRVTFTSNDFTADGLYLDDFEAHCIDPALPATGHGLATGTSFASPLVAAAAVLRRALHPDESVVQTRAAILAGARVQPRLAGKVAGNRYLDARGALGPPDPPAPTPTAAGPPPAASQSPPPAPIARPRLPRPRAWVQIRSRRARGRALIRRVTLRVPAHARLSASCEGKSCPFGRRVFPARKRARSVEIRSLRRTRLRPGTRLTFVLRPRRGKTLAARYVVTRAGALVTRTR